MSESVLNILITGVGGPTPRSFARAIKEIGNYKKYRLFGTDIHPYAYGLYQTDLFESSVITPRSSDPAYWKVMENLIQALKIDMAVILPEAEVKTWSKRQATGALPCKALIPDIKAVDQMLDKSILTKALSPSGLVPASVDIDINDDNLRSRVESALEYPFWIRSATGSSGLGSYKVTSYDDLIKWISINKEVTNFLASAYLPGRNLACKFLYYEGHLIRSACAERINYIMAKVAPSGITGNTSFGRLINDNSVFQVANKAMNIMFEQTGAARHGFYTVDLKEDAGGHPMVTEINVRHVAFTACFAAGGANLCEDTIRLLDNDPTFDRTFHQYQFEPGLIFLRDVDALPIIMKETDLLAFS